MQLNARTGAKWARDWATFPLETQEISVPTIFTTKLPDNLSPEDVVKDLQVLSGGTVTIDFLPSARSGQGGKLGSIDPATLDFIVQILDTQAAAAAVQTILGGVGGYLFAKTGKVPSVKTRPDSDSKG